jgi:hypothetical protein
MFLLCSQDEEWYSMLSKQRPTWPKTFIVAASETGNWYDDYCACVLQCMLPSLPVSESDVVKLPEVCEMAATSMRLPSKHQTPLKTLNRGNNFLRAHRAVNTGKCIVLKSETVYQATVMLDIIHCLCIYWYVKNELNSGNACYRWVQNGFI